MEREGKGGEGGGGTEKQKQNIEMDTEPHRNPISRPNQAPARQESRAAPRLMRFCERAASCRRPGTPLHGCKSDIVS